MTTPHSSTSSNSHAFPDTHTFAPEILRAYDIRGIVGQNLSEIDAYFVGRSFGTYLIRQKDMRDGPHKVCLGYDGRSSSPQFAQAVSQGLCDCGVDVENVQLGPTPMVYFAVKDTMSDGGIMITGSHNPPTHNGFKMTLQKGPVYGDAVVELGRIASQGDFESGQGQVLQGDVIGRYVNRLVRDLSHKKAYKIAWDAGNGAAGPVLRELVKKLPGEHILMYDEVDGLFPAHHPDPTVDENLADLRHVVQHQNCDFGIAFDGDADRIGVVDENGGIIRSDILLALYASEVLETNPGAPIIGDVKSSQVLFDEITRLGGKAVICATGHSVIKSKLNELKSPLAGELSGHIFFADKYYGFDDAFYCAIRLMNIIGQSDKVLSDLVKHFDDPVNTPEIRFDVDESKKFGYIDQIVDYFKLMAQEKADEHNEIWDVLTVDGIRLNTPQGWLLIRASNTQNALSMRVEAKSNDDLDDLLGLVAKALDHVGCDSKAILADFKKEI